MILSLLLCASSAGMEFTGQDMPGLSAGGRSFLTGVAPVNTVPADFDGDGATDILVSDAVWLRREGRFPSHARIELPAVRDDARFLTDGQALFAYSSEGIERFDLKNNRWLPRWSAPVPGAALPANPPPPLFHDIDSDGTRELLLPQADRLLVFRVESTLEAIGELDIYPPRRPNLMPATNLWAPDQPAQEASVLTRRFQLHLRGPTAATVERLATGLERVAFQRTVYNLAHTSAGGLRATRASTYQTPPLWEGMLVCHLNDDDRFDLAGLHELATRGLAVAAPLTEVLLSTDAGRTLQSLRTKAAIAHVVLADFDGDGDHDVITEQGDLFEGPPKEVLTKLSSKTRITQRFWVHVQQAGGVFDRQPRRFHTGRIDLGTTPLAGGPRWEAYRAGSLVSAGADFNGDRRTDVAVWEDANRIAIYLNQEGIFRDEPDATLPVSQGTRMSIGDVDWDGLADIIIVDSSSPAAEPVPHVFFARWTP